MLPISAMASRIQPSATLAAGAKAKEMKARGIHVFDFSLGEPDFDTPSHICQAAVAAMERGQTHYTPAGGTLELRQAVANFYQRHYGIDYTPQEVLISNGAKHSISNVVAALCGPGDEVVIPSPYWVSYSDIVGMTGARHMLVPTTEESGFKMTPDQLRSALTKKTRLVMLNSPCNPTGATYTRQELEALADVILQSETAVLSDEIYERLTYGGVRATCFATLRPELRQRTITLSGVSKTYAMTGWRVGWACGPAELIRVMNNIQSQQTGCPCSVSQAAAVAALTGEQDCVEMMRREFEARRDLVLRRLADMPNVTCRVPDGAFYVFPNVSAYFGRRIAGRPVTDSATLCQAALEHAHVNMVAGSAFGAEGFVRLSFATSREQIEAGMDALKGFLESAEPAG